MTAEQAQVILNLIESLTCDVCFYERFPPARCWGDAGAQEAPCRKACAALREIIEEA